MDIHKIGDLELINSGKKPFIFIDKQVHPRHYQNALASKGIYSVVKRGDGLITVCHVDNKHLQLTYEEIMNSIYDCLEDKRKAIRELFGYGEYKQE